MVDIEEYIGLLQKLEKSNALPQHDLETRYRSAYTRLREEVKTKTINAIKAVCFYEFPPGYDYEKINRILAEAGAKEILSGVSDICRDPDFEKVEATGLRLREYLIKRLKEESET